MGLPRSRSLWLRQRPRMLLNLGLTADAAAAHMNEPDQPETQQPSPAPTPRSPTFSLSALPFLGIGTLYDRTTHSDARMSPKARASDRVMSPITPVSSSEETCSTETTPTLAQPRVNRSNTNRKPSPRAKTSYQLAHPAAHARHKRLKLRPKLLLQLQQVSQTPRPLPVLDILPSTVYLPRLARKFPTIFRGKNGLGPNDLVIVMSGLYERTVSSIPAKHASSEDEDEDQRQVVATICQLLQDDARAKGKAEICLNFGPVWEATPLPSGSYEFVARTDDGVQVIRWALRSWKHHRVSTASAAQREDVKRFTFSIIDPSTRRHPVIASLTRNQLEVNDEYSTAPSSTTGPTTPSSGMSVVSEASEEAPLDPHLVTVDDGLRTLIIITGIWVAFREGWSHNFGYSDPVSSPNSKSLASPTASKHPSPATMKNGNDALRKGDDNGSSKELANNGKRGMSISSIRRSHTASPTKANEFPGSLSRRSNSTGAAFMERAKRRSVSSRLRHSMFPAPGENDHEIVVSRANSVRLNPSGHEDQNRPNTTEKGDTGNPQTISGSDPAHPASTDRPSRQGEPTPRTPTQNADAETPTSKSKLRHRVSSFFTIFNRKHENH